MKRLVFSSRLLVFLCLLILALVCSSCLSADGQTGDEPGEPSDFERIVAVVNDKEISVQRFNESYVDFLIRTGRNDTPRNRYAHLDNMIDAYLMADEAKVMGLDADPDYQAYMDIKERHAVGGRYFQVDFVDSLADVTEDEIKWAFKRNKEKVVARHLLFRTRPEAEQAYERLQEGESFIALANEVFETAEFDSMAGYLGVAGYWQLDDAFADAAWELKPFEYSEPVRTRYGWHIIMIENKVTQPLLTESEYQYRRKGMRSKARQRKYRIMGDQYVRSFMESLDVMPNPSAMRALAEVMQGVQVDDMEGRRNPQSPLTSEEVGQVRQELEPETVLATYFLDGDRHTFTAQQYMEWLDLLPFNEATARPGASMGRALRNHVFAAQGYQAGLDEDPFVVEEMRHVSTTYLAALMRAHVRKTRFVEPTEQQLQEAFERFGFRKLEEARADFWAVKCRDFAHADSVKDAIEAGADPASFNHYQTFINGDLLELDELGYHVRKALPERPLVLGTAEEWFVIYVKDRTLTYTDFDNVRDEIHDRLAYQLPVIDLIKELRAKGDVEVDRDLFEEIMTLD